MMAGKIFPWEVFMKRPVYALYTVPLFLALIFTSFFAGGCAADEAEGFAIYLTRDNIPPSQMEALSHIEIADSPVISEDDIIYYNSQTHELKLTSAAFQRVSELEVPPAANLCGLRQ
jgi:hypothetical protein